MGDIKLATLEITGQNTSLTLHPEWDFIEERRVHSNHHRALDGTLFSYHWSGYSTYRVPLRFIGNADRTLLHEWWRGETNLWFTLDSSADNNSTLCRIVNLTEPLGKRVAGLVQSWAGLLRLEAIDQRKNLGHPFQLDHPQFGLLDNPTISLI